MVSFDVWGFCCGWWCVTSGVVLSLWLALLLPFKGNPAPAPISTISQQLNTALSAGVNNGAGMPPGRLLF
jgi:hypothetical protein